MRRARLRHFCFVPDAKIEAKNATSGYRFSVEPRRLSLIGNCARAPDVTTVPVASVRQCLVRIPSAVLGCQLGVVRNVNVLAYTVIATVNRNNKYKIGFHSKTANR